MTMSTLKMHFRKLPPELISYRDFKKIEDERFLNSLRSLHLIVKIATMIKILTYFLISVRIYLTTEKEKVHTPINVPLMNKALSNAIMKTARLRNKFLKNSTNQNRLTYTEQRN